MARDSAGKDITVSVIVSTYNSPSHLDLCLRSIMRQSVKPSEIVVADDGSGPETAQLISALAAMSDVPVKHVWHEDNGYHKSAIMNKAVAAAAGRYLLFVDGDLMCHRHWLKDHMRFAAVGRVLGGSYTRLSKDLTAKIFSNAAKQGYPARCA